jgi:hypothetical protein
MMSPDDFTRNLRREIGKHLTQSETLRLLNKWEERHQWLATARARRESRQDWLRQLRDDQEDGQIALIVWQRDCDMCEGTSRYVLPADAKTLDAFIDGIFASAEGPVRYHIDKPSAYFESEFRDRAFEAYEDGHPHCI